MTKKSHVTKVSTILGVSAVLMLFIFVLVAHHGGISDRIRQDRGALLGNGSSVAQRIQPVGQVSVPSTETQREPVKKPVAAPTPSR